VRAREDVGVLYRFGQFPVGRVGDAELLLGGVQVGASLVNDPLAVGEHDVAAL